MRHSINEVNIGTRLYASPIKMKQEVIDTKRGIYASSCSKKVGEIYEKLNEKKSLT